MFVESRESARPNHHEVIRSAPKEPFEDLATLAAQVTGADCAAIAFLYGDTFSIKAQFGNFPWEEISRHALPCSESKSLDTTTSICIADLSRDEKYRERSRDLIAKGFRSFISVPLAIDEELGAGILIVLDQRPLSFTKEQVHSLQTIARHTILEAEFQRRVDRRALLSEVLRLRFSNAQLIEVNQIWQDSQAKLRESFRQRDEFLSVATHELKTPVTSMKLVLQLLERTCSKQDSLSRDEVLRSLGPALRQTEKLRLLIDNLLDLSRIREGRLVLERETFDITALANEVCHRMLGQSEWMHQPLKMRFAEPVVGEWDRLRLEQVLTHLLSNAIKYGGGKPIEVRVERTAECALIEVLDQGIGIPAESQKSIFKPYERATRAHRTDSLGVGLYIAQCVVQAHGGTIEVKSEPGRGSAFTVRLPLYPGDGKFC
jgi:signal transduction histidine kinase